MIFYSISNVVGINSCIIQNENNSSKINHRSQKKLCFEPKQEQREERAAGFTLSIFFFFFYQLI